MNWTSSKLKTFCASKDTIYNAEIKSHNGRKHSEIIFDIRNLYLEYLNSCFNSILKRQIRNGQQISRQSIILLLFLVSDGFSDSSEYHRPSGTEGQQCSLES